MIKSRLNKKKINLFSIIQYFFLILLSTLFIYLFFFVYQSQIINKIFINYVEKFSLNYEYLLKQVNVNKLKNIKNFEIEKYFNDYKNTSIFLIPINEISDLLIKNKWVDKVSIKSDYKNTIDVEVIETIPIGIYYDDDNNYFFDKNGSIIDSVNLEIIKYNNLIIFSGADCLPNAKFFLESIPLHLKNRVKEAIYINFRRWDIQLKNGLYLKLSENNISESFFKYDKIYKNISNNELREIESLDLRIPKQAIIKFKNQKYD